MEYPTPIFLENRTNRIDRLRYPCDLGRLADALLLYDSLLFVTDGFRDVVGLIDWLGPEATLQLISDKSLRFVLVQRAPQVIHAKQRPDLRPTQRKLNTSDYGIGCLEKGSKHHPRREDTRLRNSHDLLHYLRGYFRHGSYLPEGWSISDELIQALAGATTVLQAEVEDALTMRVRSLLNDRAFCKTVSFKATACLGRPSVLHTDLSFDQDGGVQLRNDLPSEARDFILYDLNGIVESVYENLIAVAFSADMMMASPTGLTALAALQPEARGVLHPEVEAFRRICSLEQLPRLADAVFRHDIPGEAILSMRRSHDGQRFRQWLHQSNAGDLDPEQILSRYVSSLITLGGAGALGGLFRFVVVSAVGFFNPVAGLAAGATDWLIGRNFVRRRWTPRVLVDDYLRPHLSQGRASARELHIPSDPRPLLREGFKVRALEQHETGFRLELNRSISHTIILSYGRSPKDLALLNRRLHELYLASEGPIVLRCSSCHAENRLQPGWTGGSIKCGHDKCRDFIFPLR